MFKAAVVLLLGFVISVSYGDISCPGQTSTCPDATTCCQLSDGTYGCCPFPNAICCTDQVHCCPQNTACNLEQQSCDSTDGFEQLQWGTVAQGTPTEVDSDSISWSEKFPSAPLDVDFQDGDGILCKDGQSTCPDGTTCCQLSAGGYGCCPMPNAVCCEDHIHCCPSGTTCNVEEGKCEKQQWRSALFRWGQNYLPKAKQVVIGDPITCGDEKSLCPDGTTCCLLKSGKYGCCPMTNAVCCDDQIHCCPESTTCDTEAGMCRKADGDVISAWHPKIPAVEGKSEGPQLNVCPGLKTSCPEGTSCCLSDNDNTYGCCPFPVGICCSDGRHCCPVGFTCNILRHTCDQATGEIVRWFSPAKGKIVAEEEDSDEVDNDRETDDVEVCRDGVSGCPKWAKCCPSGHAGRFRCCLFKTGVCCSQGHCCPSGLKCADDGCAPRHSFNFLQFLRESADRSA